eukprot:CAMPEP_0184494712 /NCGR_PEP_ID=MMETSP0113_2-20130426/29411_1 /TAXON_ID=91329 /ORGANISM="Norrisiella sphaerica, Strain BC52" /LENGTH=587 /DNA_ID=CAMNT_0026880575 /DNA_START=58 /DNA_END=1821 /DNA_ORIENTATION=+
MFRLASSLAFFTPVVFLIVTLAPVPELQIQPKVPATTKLAGIRQRGESLRALSHVCRPRKALAQLSAAPVQRSLDDVSLRSPRTGLRWKQKWIKLKQDLPKGFHLTHHGLLRAVRREVSDVKAGILHLRIVSEEACGMMLNEKADPAISTDLQTAFDKIFSRNLSNPDTMMELTMADAQASIVGSDLVVPIVDRELALGPWQGFYLCEFLGDFKENEGSFQGNSPHNRRHERYLVATIQEVPAGSVKIFDHPVASRGAHPVDLSRTSLLLNQASNTEKENEAEKGYSSNSQDGVGSYTPLQMVGPDLGLEGVLHVMVRHTSASLANRRGTPDAESDADSDTCGTMSGVRTTLEASLSRVCPDKWSLEGLFDHDYEGPDDMPGHVKSGLLGAYSTSPVLIRTDSLSTSQKHIGSSMELWEHRECLGSSREVVACYAASDILDARTVDVEYSTQELVADITEAVVRSIETELRDVDVGFLHIWSKDGFCIMASRSRVAAEMAVNQARKMLSSGAEMDKLAEDDPFSCAQSALLGVKMSIPIRDGKLILGPSQRMFLHPLESEYRSPHSSKSSLARHSRLLLVLQGAASK